jgi:hypothetical protein
MPQSAHSDMPFSGAHAACVSLAVRLLLHMVAQLSTALSGPLIRPLTSLRFAAFSMLNAT